MADDYALDDVAREQARRRLALLERQLDPASQRRLAELGVSEGWHCLEVGGGGGSVTRWLCRRVGASGHLLATDLDTRFLREIDEPMLEVRRHDVTAEALPQGRFDLVYTRWLLHHLPHQERVIASMAAALRPGGWLLIEEVDFFPVYASASELYVDFMVALTEAIVAESGGDAFWARALPALVAGRGLTEVGAEGDIGVLRGGSAWAEFFELTGEQMREEVVCSGALSAERFDAALALLEDPRLWAFGGAGIAAWGRRPHDGGESQGQ